jgi:hypothetical protein
VATSSSSSAKKVAKLAQRGKGKKVRFQGGTLFPAVVLGVVIVGLLTIVYARESRPDPGSFPPQVGDHWHAAYGMYVCDGWLPKLTGNQEEKTTSSDGSEQYVNEDFGSTGIHSHDDGVIHYHPYSAKAVGKRAKLGVFLDVYDVELDTEHLKLPASQGGEEWDVDDFKCDGKDVQIKVIAWDNFSDTGDGTTYITDLRDVRITQDGMVFAIVVAPKDTNPGMPPWADELPELGAADTANVPETTVEGDGTATTVAESTPGSTTGSTVPSSTDTATTPPSSDDVASTSSVTATTGG